ncbi:hypothetical protein FJQ98_12290 [Lysinibacillus agricola]|uniref:Secreted protein n=1 Tax=Lysinibacillus agricola TaxID=2590012 RepID=A0ABX7AXW7_9BACI|nr:MULTISPECIES: hypothetical protein [Lysinibacillus]QQP14709.1 hypothetical protein FJQ98_12290 [Lysinibacillus agricola]
MTKKKLIRNALLVLLLMVVMITNSQSLNFAKKSCEKQQRTAIIEQSFAGLNWTVTCQE